MLSNSSLTPRHGLGGGAGAASCVDKCFSLPSFGVTAWADADVPYFPVCNADGATPLEVAVAAKNHLFTSYLLDREKGTKGVMWNTDPTWKHAASFRPDLITARDLSMLLEWPSALGYAVQVGLCSRFGQSWRSGITWRRLPRWYAHNSTQRAHSSPPSLP